LTNPLALLVMPHERRSPLVHSLESFHFETLTAGNCREARKLLQTAPPVEVVLTQVSLADGNWADILRYLVDNDMRASVIVSSPRADEHLWSEILWRGGYDLLVEPYEPDELRKTIEGALRAAYQRPLTALPASLGAIS
jgi:DNA-binding NtrC family response regulator